MNKLKLLTCTNHSFYVKNFSLLNTMVFEELLRSYKGYEFEQAPYDYYNADYVISPRDTKNHAEYFGYVKPLAIDLFEKWYSRLAAEIKNTGEIKILNAIGRNITHARDMVDLVWYSMQLLNFVNEYTQMRKESGGLNYYTP